MSAQYGIRPLTIDQIDRLYLERGRGLVLGQRLEAWHELSELREAAPSLATRFDELRAAAIPEQGNPLKALESRKVLSLAWTQLLGEIRALPRFARFALGPSEGELASDFRERVRCNHA